MVLVSGTPGSGKTTLATPLAQASGFPLISKDYMNEHDGRIGIGHVLRVNTLDRVEMSSVVRAVRAAFPKPAAGE